MIVGYIGYDVVGCKTLLLQLEWNVCYGLQLSSVQQTKTVLSAQNSVAILVYLVNQGGSAKASHIQNVVGNYNSVVTAGRRLEAEGLIKITIFTGKLSYHLYELTEKGRQVALKLNEAESLL